jgi:hypothetical protein
MTKVQAPVAPAAAAPGQAGTRQWVPAWAGVAGPLLAVGGAVAYGALRISYERFYAVFGLSPEEAGVSSTSILGESGVGIVSLIVAITVVPALCCALMAGLITLINDWKYAQEEHGRDRPRTIRSRRWKVIRGVVLGSVVLFGLPQLDRFSHPAGIGSMIVLFFLAGVWALSALRSRGHRGESGSADGLTERQWWFRLMTLGLVAIGAVIALYYVLIVRPVVPPSFRGLVILPIAGGPIILLWMWAGATAKSAEHRPQQRRMIERWGPFGSESEGERGAPLWALLCVVITLVSVFFISGLPRVAARAADCTAAGRGPVRGITTPGRVLGYGPFVLLGVRAVPVKLEYKSDHVANAPRDGLVLLGQADGALVLWDVKARQIVRIAAGDVLVRTQPVHPTKSVCEQDRD